jgi:hypothetical protein
MPELENPVITAMALIVVVDDTVKAVEYTVDDVVGSLPFVV